MLKCRSMLVVVASTASLSWVGGCAHQIDAEAWRADLAKHGVTIRGEQDWEQFQSAVLDACNSFNSSQLELWVLSQRDTGDGDAVMRLNFRYACPDQLDDLEKAMADADANALASPITHRPLEVGPAGIGLGSQAFRVGGYWSRATFR